MERDANQSPAQGGREPTVGPWHNDPVTGSRVRRVGDPLSPHELDAALWRNEEELAQRRRNRALAAILGLLLVGFTLALLALIFSC